MEKEMLKLNVPDMTCGHCASRVTDAVKGVDAGAAVNVDLQSKTVTVETAADREQIRKALEQAGYPADAA
jgi:copper chaperone